MMKKRLTFIILLAVLGMQTMLAGDYASLVNTLQGSYNTEEFSHGRCNPIVGYPSGVNFWSPSAFTFAKGKIGGIGGCGLNMIPVVSENESTVSDFVAKTIEGHPYLFKVTRQGGATIELTSTERCAYVRFTFPKGKCGMILMGSRGEWELDGRTLRGFVDVPSGHYRITDRNYFLIEFDRAPENFSEGVLRFTGKAPVSARVAVSKVSAEQAALNFSTEIASKTFDQVKEESRAVWNRALGKIEVEGGTSEQQKTFYSCLFKALLRPSRNYDIDAAGNPVFGYDSKPYSGKYHNNPILWDAYRCLLALHDIINVEEQKDYVLSLMKTKELTGWWPSGHVMIGNHAISVLADAWAKGIRNFDPAKALEYYYDEITHSQLDSLTNGAYNKEHLRGFGRMGFEEYFAKGYISYPQDTDRVMETTSKTIEYNYDDFCAYKLARMTNNRFYEDLFAKHIFNYRNVFDPKDSFFKGRDASGVFDKDFNPYEWGGAFVEGNGWQWRFAVQQDAQGMMDLMGGEKKFINNLDALFAAPADSVLYGGYGYWIHEITEAVAGGQGQYAQGNEPCFHVIHLYNHAGQPWKAQAKLRESMTRLYDSSPKGFPGDEDGGAMSAWYVFNAMGFYPVTPGVPEYTIGSPLFNRITINLENDKKFIIEADGNSAENVYIDHAELNGTEYTCDYLGHEVLMNGGTLRFRMSPTPNFERGTSAEDRPYSLSREARAGSPIMTGNPVLTGNYADPEVAEYDGRFWIFPTSSAGRGLQAGFDAFASYDLKNWEKYPLALSASDISWYRKALWAPATVCKDGKYYLFFSANDIQHPQSRWWNPETDHVGDVGGIGVAVADSPEGPYKDYLGHPLINDFYNMAQPIDQFIFHYEGCYYIIYGGWGRCNIGRLNDDFTALVPFDDGDMVKEITPEGYVEGPVMFVRKGQLYFMWSEGNWAGGDYRVRYAMADTPFGPFKPLGTIVSGDRSIATSPGHNSVLNVSGTDDWYLVYHRRPVPNYHTSHRVTCIDRLVFNDDGTINPVIMTNSGVETIKR